MAEIIKVDFRNMRSYAHVVCGSCGEDLFAVRTGEVDDCQVFMSLICEKCGNEIYVELKPVRPPAGA